MVQRKSITNHSFQFFQRTRDNNAGFSLPAFSPGKTVINIFFYSALKDELFADKFPS